MRGNKNKGIVKVLGIGLTAAVLSFTLTGVAENAVTGAVSGKSVSDGLRQLTALSVMRQAVRRIFPVKHWCRSTLPPM